MRTKDTNIQEKSNIKNRKIFINIERYNGVTLIALVVTIVVLLILAGVSIAMLSGDNGLITQTKNASEEWEKAQDKEQLELTKQAELIKGTEDIIDEKLKALNNEYFNVKKYKSSYQNMKSVAYMLDTDVWNNFKGIQAEYAIGGPTIELLMKSYNEKYGTNYMAQAYSQIGYRISDDGGKTWNQSLSGILSVDDELYVKKDVTKASAMWIASPGIKGDDYVMYVAYHGSINGNPCDSNFLGFRPVVCLKSGLGLEKQDDGTYHIINTIKTGKIIFEKEVWEENKASIEVNTNTNFNIEWQKNGVNGEWSLIENNGKISGLNAGDTIYARLTDGTNYGDYASVTISKQITDLIGGEYYDVDTDIEIGDYNITIPAGAVVSNISGEYESIQDGVVIYITNGEEITDWNEDLNSNGIKDVQEKYDQFVWIPIDKESAIIEEGKEIIGNTEIEKYNSLKTYVSEISSPTNGPSKYPMAVKKTDGTYSGILYDFKEENGVVKLTPLDYTTVSEYREPDILDRPGYALDDDYGITKSSLQKEYKAMIERVVQIGGFWVGRYETSNMDSFNYSKDSVNIIKGTLDGINYTSWYDMHKGQKAYKNSEDNKILNNSAVTSGMIWGSQWDQIMIWMRDIKNTVNQTKGKYYVTNSEGMGNFGNLSGINDGFTDTLNPAKTGCFEVKNIYDLAGNLDEWVLEAYSDDSRAYRGNYYGSTYDNKASDRKTGNNPTSSQFTPTGSRVTLY